MRGDKGTPPSSSHQGRRQRCGGIRINHQKSTSKHPNPNLISTIQKCKSIIFPSSSFCLLWPSSKQVHPRKVSSFASCFPLALHQTGSLLPNLQLKFPVSEPTARYFSAIIAVLLTTGERGMGLLIFFFFSLVVWTGARRQARVFLLCGQCVSKEEGSFF